MSNDRIALTGYSIQVSGKTTWFFVALGLGDAVGYGEATVFGSEAELSGLIVNLCQSIGDRPAETLPDLTAQVLQSDATLARRGLASALEQAWLSALADRARVPLVSLLGGVERNEVPFYANINRGITQRTPEGFARQALLMIAKTGASGVKIAPFDGFRHGKSSLKAAQALIAAGIERVTAVREAIGADKLLMVDCHSRFSPVLARNLFRELSRLNVFWVEDPCDMASLGVNQLHALRGCANSLGLRIAGGESVLHPGEMAVLLDREGHDVVLPDLRYTGIRDGMAMLSLARLQGLEVSLHNPAGPVLDAISIHVSAALPSFLILERQLGETPLYEGIVTAPVLSADGRVSVPNGRGLGLSLDRSFLIPVEATAEQRRLTHTYTGMAGAGPDA